MCSDVYFDNGYDANRFTEDDSENGRGLADALILDAPPTIPTI